MRALTLPSRVSLHVSRTPVVIAPSHLSEAPQNRRSLTRLLRIPGRISLASLLCLEIVRHCNTYNPDCMVCRTDRAFYDNVPAAPRSLPKRPSDEVHDEIFRKEARYCQNPACRKPAGPAVMLRNCSSCKVTGYCVRPSTRFVGLVLVLTVLAIRRR